MAVTISGMFGNGNTYFVDSPVVITVSGLEWGSPVTSPFTIVRVEVIYNGKTVGDFRCDTGGQTSATFDISSALRAIWSDYSYDAIGCEIAKAGAAITADSYQAVTRSFRSCQLVVYTEYLASDGVFTTTSHGPFSGAHCAIGGFTEWERTVIASPDISVLQNTNTRNGDASTKPSSSPERVGSTSITSWVDVGNAGTQSAFFPASVTPAADGASLHAPLVLRDSQPYVDFLFINRRGAVETCSGLTKEAMGINTDVKQYSRTERPSFTPSRSLMAIGTDGRRSWQMSSGYVTREWAEWWTMEFLGGKRKQWWMLWRGPGLNAARYVPVTVKPAKNDTAIYDRSKQQMAHVDFTVTLALEG